MKEKTLKTVRVRKWKFAILLALVGVLTAGLFYTSYHQISNLIKNNELPVTGLSKYINTFTISLIVAIVLLIFLFSFHKDFSHISSHVKKVRSGDFTNQIDIDKIPKNSKVYDTAREFNFMSNKLNNTIKDVVRMTGNVRHYSKTLELISKDEEINNGKLKYMAEDIKLSLAAQNDYLEDAFSELSEVYEKIHGIDDSLTIMKQDVNNKVKLVLKGKDSLNYLNQEINNLTVLLEDNIDRTDSLRTYIKNLEKLVENIENSTEKIGLLTLIANVEDDSNRQPEANKEIKIISDDIEKTIKSISVTFENIEENLNNLQTDINNTKNNLQTQNKKFENIDKYNYAVDEFLKYSQFNIDENLEILNEIINSKDELFASRENISSANMSISEKIGNISSISNEQVKNTWKIKEQSRDLFTLSKNLKKELEEFKVK